MEAKTVYEAQQALLKAEHALAELARQEAEAQRAGAWISSGDYLRSPEGRAVAKKREAVEAMQAEIGGVVYRIPVENLDVVEKLAKLAKRAKTKELGELSYRLAEREVVEVKRWDAVVSTSTYQFLVLKAEMLKLAGWMLLATLTIEEGGVMISKVPGFARAWALHREGKQLHAPGEFHDEVAKAAQETLDALDLGAYRDEAKATHCDHCDKARRRTKTYLVEHAETGEIKQVGANCLRDFLGTDPARLAAMAQLFIELEEEMGEDSVGWGLGGRSAQRPSVIDYLTHVCAVIRVEGWVGRSEHRDVPTADQAMSNIANYGKLHKGVPQYVEVEQADYDRALAAREWVLDFIGAKVHQSQTASDFDHNMYVAAKGDTIPKKGVGVLAYVPVAHAKHQEREIERKAREATAQEIGATSTWVGKEKDRIDVTGEVLAVFERGGQYGTTFITKILGDDGNVYKWFGSYDLGRGNKITGKFTVKKHDEYQGVKETVVTRPGGVKVLEADGERVEFNEGDMVRDPDTGRDGKVVAVNLIDKSVVVEFEEDAAPEKFYWVGLIAA